MTDDELSRRLALIEKEVELLKKQANVHWKTINAIIERDDAIMRQINSALGQLKPGTVPKIEHIDSVIKGDEEQ